MERRKIDFQNGTTWRSENTSLFLGSKFCIKSPSTSDELGSSLMQCFTSNLQRGRNKCQQSIAIFLPLDEAGLPHPQLPDDQDFKKMLSLPALVACHDRIIGHASGAAALSFSLSPGWKASSKCQFNLLFPSADDWDSSSQFTMKGGGGNENAAAIIEKTHWLNVLGHTLIRISFCYLLAGLFFLPPGIVM